MKSQWLIVMLAFALSTFGGQADGGDAIGHLRAVDLRCEYLREPRGLGETSPRLMWVVEADRRAEEQSAYRVLVASSPELLDAEEGDLWDTGRIETDDTTHIVYGGKPLGSRTVCHWKVMVWDRDGAAGEWSEPARWEMGLLGADDWSAQWVDAAPRPVQVAIVRAEYSAVDGSARRDVTNEVAAMLERGERIVASNTALGGDPAPGVLKRLAVEYRCDGVPLRCEVAENAEAVLARARAPYLRRSFRLAKPVRSARLYATALGMYELCLNGQRVGDHYLAPGWTDYRERVQYQVYDVTDQLAQGENALGALVAPGWFSGRAGLFSARAFYGQSPAVRVQLEITHTDGSSVRIVSDGAWRRRSGPILAADLMDGEIYDARAELDGWCSPAVSDADWSPVETRAEPRTLVSTIDPPVRALQELPALALTEPQPGRWTFDLGQNMVGVVRLRVSEAPGTAVTIRHGELLSPDESLYTANLRAAAATDTYICKGEAIEEWQPRFTYHGFRYIELTGLSQRPELGAVTGIVLGSDLPPAGEFACSDAGLNQLQSNILWGLRGNFVSIPTDCPQRDERMGWTADTQVFAPTAAFNADVAAFMTKWMTDVADAQRPDGAHSDVAPVMKGLSYGTPAWGDAGTVVPWMLYQVYGDTRILKRHIESMIRWVEWCRANSTGLIRDHARGNDYGDWLSVKADTPKDLVGTAYFAHSAGIVSKSLRVLGRDAEAERYQQLFDDIREAFMARYVDSDGRVAGNTQCGYVLALRFGLLPAELRDRAAQHLIADIEARGWHLSTGFVGVGQLLPALTEAGHAGTAYDLLLQDTFPSWLFSVRHGATTIWERWDGWTPERGAHPDISMNSFNHYSLGACGEWLYSAVAGIEPDPASPGFGHFFIRPRLEGPLTSARAEYRSIRGRIATSWAIDGDRLALRIAVPANTTATVFLPARESAGVLESGRELGESQGVQPLRREPGTVVLRVGSGEYEFASRLPAARSGNPVIPGWYADPEVACFNGRYWIYPTYSAPYDQQTHFDAFSSPDLVRWTKHPRVLHAGSVPWAKRAMWAPSVIEKGGRYFFFFGANDIQSNDEPGGIGVAVSDAPDGPFRDYLGKPLIDAFHNGAQPIDQFVFRDTDGRDYLIYGGWRHCNIARLSDDYRGFEPFDDGATFREITPEGYVEGPFMFIRDGKYYFMWSEGGWTGPDYSVAYAIADSPLGPFQRIGKILKQDPTVATGAGHHSVLKIPGKDEYYIVYHRRPLGETDGNHRVVCIDRMTFDADGRINPVKITFEGVDPPQK